MSCKRREKQQLKLLLGGGSLEEKLKDERDRLEISKDNFVTSMNNLNSELILVKIEHQ